MSETHEKNQPAQEINGREKLGRMEQVGTVKKIWGGELQFSAWLAGQCGVNSPANIVCANCAPALQVGERCGLALLGQSLDMALVHAEINKPIGDFFADVVCRDEDDNLVVVENQLWKTDHDHLGKLLTYAAQVRPMAVVWIAEEFRDEHRAALEWMNEQTIHDVRFIGMEIQLWRIDGSRVAPHLQIVASPEEYAPLEEEAGDRPRSEIVSPSGGSYFQYWQRFLDFLRQSDSSLRYKNKKPLPYAGMNFSIGGTDFSLRANVVQQRKIIRAEFLIHENPPWPMFHSLERDKGSIESEAGVEWQWEAPPGGGRGQSRIRIVKDGCDVNDESQWEAQHQWLKDQLESLDKAFRQRIRNLPSDNQSSGNESEEQSDGD